MIIENTVSAKPCAGCGKSKEPFAGQLLDRFWSKSQKGITMQYVVSRQIAIEAESPEQAIEKTKQADGATLSVSANPRPQAPPLRTSIPPQKS